MPSGIINSIIASWSVFHYQLQKITSNKRHGISKNIVITPVYCLVTALGWLLVAPAAFSQNPTTRQQDFVYKSADPTFSQPSIFHNTNFHGGLFL